ncbi:MAG: monofunctional biosynthetic peptidoglycan transglycosylase [Pseudomonadales bacterium]|nr:monofunctional biosynthetic peptidoglycan transglycosylase [Pseudomonadales bacterium]NRA16893.1 monofunctional biosynthetic peptidoglycan transglycosylase [Oceanospirillaceae bacterium]
MKMIIRALLKLLLVFVVTSVSWVALYKVVDVRYTPLMLIRYFQGGDDYRLRHQWRDLDKISSQLQLAVISSEDQNFFQHRGFDFQAIQRALQSNGKGKALRGGSTISQQSAKNVFLWPQRSWLRKGLEAWFTLLIEIFWSKERILEVYLNSIEMGKGVFGAQAAAYYWFNKPAATLQRSEAAAIAAILPNPIKFKATPATRYIKQRKAWIIKQMGNYGPLPIK